MRSFLSPVLVAGGLLSVIGIGEDGLDGLSSAARALVQSADLLIGGERHLAMVPRNTGQERRSL